MSHPRHPAAHAAIQPDGWPRPSGYVEAMAAAPGRTVHIAGQVGWDPLSRTFASTDLVPQFEQALKNVLALVAAAGGGPGDVVRITAFCIDKRAYLAGRKELGRAWKKLMGGHYPPMSLIFVNDLLATDSKIELEATAVVAKSGRAPETSPLITEKP